MNIIIKVFTEENAKDLCLWQYEDDYKVYNYVDWHTAVNKTYGISQPCLRKNEFLSFYLSDEFIGFGRMTKINNSIRLGIGLKPDLCGRGIGSIIFKSLIKETKKRYGDIDLILNVRKFNIRAIKCYEKSGFIIRKEHSKKTKNGQEDLFVEMFLDKRSKV